MSLKKIQVLVVDNDPDFLDMLSNLLPLKIANLSVTQAISKEEALDKIDNQYFNLAIIDKRLVQDTDPTDESGIELTNAIAQNHPWLRFVMLTSFAEYKDITSMLRKADEFGEYILLDYISKKEESPEEWCVKIKKVLEEYLGVNFDLNVKLVGFEFKELNGIFYNTRFKNKRITADQTALIDSLVIELMDLFGKIYYYEKKISITPMEKQGRSGSVIVRAHLGEKLTEIFKFGEREKLETEYRNYKQHVAGMIAERTFIDEGKFARAKNLAAIAYSLIGADIDDIKNFGEYYHDNKTGAVIDFLNTFFRENCKAWYSNFKAEEPFNLKETYEQYLNLSYPALQKSLEENLPNYANQRLVKLDNFGFTWENPVMFASHIVFRPISIRECRTHGDLHINNILVARNRGWLIDFGNTGWGHSLRDFIMLEVNIKFQLITSISLADLIHLENALLSISSLNDDSQLEGYDSDNSIKKAFDCISHIRKLAYDLTKPKNTGEYFTGLFFTTLKSLQFYKVSGFTKSRNKRRLEFVFISAGLILEKLKSLGLVKTSGPGDLKTKNSDITGPPGNVEREKKYTFDAFICHASEDKTIVEEISEILKKSNIAYWVDHEQIKLGDTVLEKIEDGLTKSKNVVVVLSENLAKSNWCRAEYGPILSLIINKKSGKKVIPLKIDDCKDEDIPLLLYDRKSAHYSNKEEFDDLLNHLKGKKER